MATDSYRDTWFRQLRAPLADAEVLREVLEDPAIGGYSVKVLTNEASHVVNEAVDDFLGSATVQDMVLLYFSGHGFRDDHGRLYLVTENSRHTHMPSTAVAATFIRERLDNCRSRGKLVMLDCCYAGAFPAGIQPKSDDAVDVLARLSGRGSAVMTASSSVQLAFESGNSQSPPVGDLVTPSVFTAALIDGLRTGNADVNGDGLIDFDELYDYVYKQVLAKLPQQTPGRSSDLEGTLYVAVSARGPRPANLHPDLAIAVSSPLPSVKQAVVLDLVALSAGAHPGMLLTVRTVLNQLANDDSRLVAASAQAALQQLDEADERGEMFSSAGGHAAASPPAAASLMAAAELEVDKLRSAADQELARKRAAAQQEIAEQRTAAAREVALIIESAKQESSAIIATARQRSDEMRSEAQRILDASEATRAKAEAELAQSPGAPPAAGTTTQIGAPTGGHEKGAHRYIPDWSSELLTDGASGRAGAEPGGTTRAPLAKARDIPAGFSGDALIIQGVYCKNGHFDDPEALFCGVCGISMHQQKSILRPGPRPSLGVLCFDDGAVFQLDQNYVVGREPGLDATVAAGRVRPLRVSDDSGGVSRVHAKITLDGWRVLVTDLGSANGTRVKLPRAAGEQVLQPQLPFVLTTGSVVDLGRARSFRYESHRGR